MKNTCADPINCPCAAGAIIEAHNNAVGPAMMDHVPELRPLLQTAPELNLRYCPVHDDRDPDVAEVRKLAAAREDVYAEEVTICGSVLDRFDTLASYAGCETVAKLDGDFGGYERGENIGVKVERIPVDPCASTVDVRSVANAVRKLPRPLVSVSYPLTNPYQQDVPAEIVDTILEANKDAVVLVDGAYRRFGGKTANLAKMASRNERVIYVQTAAKDMFVCGARIGWIVCAPNMQARIRKGITAYQVSTASMAQLRALLGTPEVMEKVFRVQRRARDILVRSVATSGLDVRTGAAPWVMVKVGDVAERYADVLLESFGVKVQPQTSAFLKGWLRISATVPCQAQKAGAALRIMADGMKLVSRGLENEFFIEDLVARINAEAERKDFEDNLKWLKSVSANPPKPGATVLPFPRNKCA